MRRRTLVSALLLALPLTAPALHAQAASKPAADSSLAAMDTDHDGKVSRAEWKGNDIGFAMLDANGDGVLSGSELTPAGDTRAAQDPAAEFARLDRNHDGTLSRDEWTDTSPNFARRDHNGDGKISRDEFLNLDREKIRMERLFRFLDKNHDGRISRAEWPTFDEQKDRNHDGYVTKEEFFQQQ